MIKVIEYGNVTIKFEEETEMALLDKVLGKDSRVRELEKEIRSLEVRKSSVFASITETLS